MKRWLFSLVVTVILVGCAPGDVIVIERPSDSDSLHPVMPTPMPNKTATNVPLWQTVTPNPAGQILDGTSWVLDHHLIEGEVRELKYYETLLISFGPHGAGIDDGCNLGGFENTNGGPVYAATEKGEFVLPFREVAANGSYSVIYRTTELACYATDEETGEKHLLGIRNFMPLFQQLVAYELRDDQLLLYYPEDKQNALVFQAWTIEPRPTEIPKPIRIIGPTSTPGPTYIPPTPMPTCPSPLTPTYYPAPLVPCFTPAQAYP